MVGTNTISGTWPTSRLWRFLTALVLTTLVVATAAPAGAESTAEPEADEPTNPWDLTTTNPLGWAGDDLEPEPYEWDSVIEGMTFAASSVYEARPDAGDVLVTTTIDVTNVKPPVTRGWTRTSYYFDAVWLPIPVIADDVVAVSRGREVDFELEPVEDADSPSQWLVLDLPRNLNYRQSRTIELTYRLPTGAVRTDAAVVINDAHVSFPVIAFGDAGATSVEIRLPDRFEVEVIGEYVRPVEEDGVAVYRYEELSRPLDFYTYLSGADEEALVETPVKVGGIDITVRSWPGDDAWKDFTVELLPDVVRELEELMGIPVPDIGELDVIESAAPYLYGYAGWYSVRDGEIEVGDALDEHVLVHEVSHIWLNEDLFAERWITEGIANDLSSIVLDRLDIESDWEPEPVARYAPGASRLNIWDTPRVTGPTTRDSEEWGYNAAWFVIRRLREDVGDVAFLDILSAVDQNLSAYRLASVGEPPATTDAPRSWHRLLDLLEEVAGSDEAYGLFEKWVLTDNELGRVDRRNETRERYHALDVRDLDWDLPLSIRSSMDLWQFEEADVLMEEAGRILDQRALVEARAAELDLMVHPDLKAAYESLDDGGAAAAVAVAADQMAAMSSVEMARSAVAAPRSFAVDVGLYGETPDEQLAVVESAYAANDLEGAVEHSAQLVALLDDAERVGTLRIQRTAAAAAAVLVLLVVLVIWRVKRRRRRRREASEAVHPAGGPSDAAALRGALPPMSDESVLGGRSVEKELEDGVGDPATVLHGAEVGESLHGD